MRVAADHVRRSRAAGWCEAGAVGGAVGVAGRALGRRGRRRLVGSVSRVYRIFVITRCGRAPAADPHPAPGEAGAGPRRGTDARPRADPRKRPHPGDDKIKKRATGIAVHW